MDPDVVIEHAYFVNNTGGDSGLNLIKSVFEIDDTLFKNSLHNGVNIELSKGSIKRSSFVGLGR